MNDEISLKKDKASLCRIKVNKMISSLNSHKDIFIPKYTLTNRNEAKYLSDINKSRKGYSSKASKNKINNIKKISYQNKANKTYRITTKYNYLKQPIDFIINHGVLVYQRNFNGDEVINYGINNEYLRKNRLNMIKNNSSIYQTKTNFAQTENNNMYNKYHKFDLSHQKKSMNNNSKKRLISISDISSSKAKKNISIINNKMNNINLKINKNDINNLNSISIKNLLASSNKKTLTDKNISSVLNTKKILINYKRKKNINNHKFLIIKKKKNLNSILGNEEDSNANTNLYNKNISKNNMNYNNNIIPRVNKKSYIIHLKNKIKKEDKKNDKILIELFEKINKYFLKKYFNLFINKIKENKKREREKERGKRLNTNKYILENSRLNKKIQNSFEFPNHKRSKSISMNRKISSSSLISKDIQKNKNKNKINLSLLKNLRFLSTDKGDKSSELCRDSKSLQKKSEQINNRKRREMTMTFSNRIKNDSVSVFENNYLSDINKTNSFSNINDNNSTNSFINLGLNQKKFRQIFYKDNNFNLNNSDNRKDRSIYKIKLIKGNNNKQKKIISYRIEKANEKENKKEKNEYKNLSEIRYINNKTTNSNNGNENKKNYSNDIDINNKNINKYSKKKQSFNIFIDNNMADFKVNNKIRKNNELKNKNNVRIKEIYTNNILNDIKINKNNNKIRLHVIKNICTKDKRIFINIKYLPMVSKLRNITRYNYKILKIKKIMNYNYIGIRRIKNLVKRNSELEKKLTLIREEDEKSKFQNSYNSIKYIDEDELHSSKKINKNIRVLKDKKNYKLYLTKMVNILEQLYFKYYINNKKYFIKRLKVIYFVFDMKKIINNKIKNTNVYKLLKRKNKGMIYYPKSERYKIRNKFRKIPNIYIEDKVYLNNIIINDKNFLTNSFDFKREFKIFESPNIRPKIYYRNNIIDFSNNSEIHQILSKTENKKFNKNLVYSFDLKKSQ